MLINIQLCQSADVNLEFIFSGKAVGQLLIETMDALNHQNILRSQLQIIAPVFPLTGNKIVHRQLNPFPCQKIRHILVKQLNIQTFQSLIIVVAIFISGTVYTVYKIIIYCYGMGRQSLGSQLNGQAMGKCSFSRRGGAILLFLRSEEEQ